MDSIGEPEFKTAKKELSKLIATSSTALNFFKFLGSRRRSSPITDLPQALLYMRKQFGNDVNQDEINSVLSSLFRSKICLMRNEAGRIKIHWFHWLFPIFSQDGNTLLGIETKPIKTLQENRNAFGRAQKQVEKIKSTFHLPSHEREHKADIEFEVETTAPIQRTDLSQFSVEELLKELERRGLKLQLSVKKTGK
ncbi:MAG: hypothetical protein K2X47_11560 [Bdellovibrionales bacterium]|nr:hypothetical protein [Bdellovibrionales bacterium]